MKELYDNSAHVETTFNENNLSEYLLQAQWAEMVERSGIHSIEQLKDSDPTTLAAQLRERQELLSGDLEGAPGKTTVERWVNEAKNHKFTATA